MTPRLVAAALVALLLSSPLPAAARASAPAAAVFGATRAGDEPTAPAPAAFSAAMDAPESPFPRVPLEPGTPRGSHLGAYALLAAGAGLVGWSFALEDQANRAYDAYLVATTPDEIERLFDRTTHYDHLSSSALIGGEVLFATGLWMRFLHHPRDRRVALLLRPDRCALALHF